MNASRDWEIKKTIFLKPGNGFFFREINNFIEIKRNIKLKSLKYINSQNTFFFLRSDIDEYIDSGFLALQRSIDKAYIELTGEQNPNEFKVIVILYTRCISFIEL